MVDEENVVRLSDSLCGICHTTNMAQSRGNSPAHRQCAFGAQPRI